VTIWLTILGMALATLVVRAAPLLIMRGELPAWLGRWLAYVPVAVFTALALRPLVIGSGAAPQIALGAPLAAGAVGALVAWRSGNVLATIVAGMAAYWALRLAGLA
jgi:branched-subunit amino acid transport protein